MQQRSRLALLDVSKPKQGGLEALRINELRVACHVGATLGRERCTAT